MATAPSTLFLGKGKDSKRRLESTLKLGAKFSVKVTVNYRNEFAYN